MEQDKEYLQTYYRPEWTCGRYSAEHKVAIFYNLIEGMSYFFEDLSAKVIGVILDIERNSSSTLQDISNASGVNTKVLSPFLEELRSYGLLCNVCPTKEFISVYRYRMIGVRKEKTEETIKELHEKSELSYTDAEREYMERVQSITSVMLELTYNCSEKCIHCYNPGATRNDNEISLRGNRTELSLSDYKRIINELCSQGLVKVCLTGGDPFSKPHIWEILDYLYDKEIAIDIFTNGQRVFNNVKRLAQYYPRTIGISLYSNIEDVHDTITRIKGSYKKTISFIQKCSEFALPMLLKCCIMRTNAKSYYTVKEVAFKYGATPQFDLNITDSLDGDKCASTNLRLTHDLMEIVLRDEDLPYYINGDGIIKIPPRFDEPMCNAGKGNVCITPEGNIQPCCAFPMVVGNVKETDIRVILKNSNLLEWWKSLTIGNCKDCHTHPYCTYCQMCAGNNYTSNGTPLQASENNCFLAIERYDLAKKMQDGYDPLNGKSVAERLEEIEIEPIVLNRVYSTNYRDRRIDGMSDKLSLKHLNH